MLRCIEPEAAAVFFAMDAWQSAYLAPSWQQTYQAFVSSRMYEMVTMAKAHYEK